MKMVLAILATMWRLKTDSSFEAVCLFSLLGLVLTLAFPGLTPG
jgi:hypothetical protein